MCAGPISVADLPFAQPAWQEEDAEWERLQRSAAAALADGDDRLGGERFSRALRLARQHFEPGDPRLAASLASHALMLSKKNDPVAAKLFTEALVQWNRFENWLGRQPLPRLARSSLFHLRLEAKHPGAYPDQVRRRCLLLAAEGREAAKVLAEGGSDRRPDRSWQPDRHAGFDLLRKVTAAVRLMAWR